MPCCKLLSPQRCFFYKVVQTFLAKCILVLQNIKNTTSHSWHVYSFSIRILVGRGRASADNGRIRRIESSPTLGWDISSGVMGRHSDRVQQHQMFLIKCLWVCSLLAQLMTKMPLIQVPWWGEDLLASSLRVHLSADLTSTESGASTVNTITPPLNICWAC